MRVTQAESANHNSLPKSEYLGSQDVDLKLNTRNFIRGSLENGQHLLILFDSGASRTLISDAAIRGSNSLSKLKTTPINPVKFQLGNGQFLLARRTIQFEICIQGHKFRIAAMIAENMT